MVERLLPDSFLGSSVYVFSGRAAFAVKQVGTFFFQQLEILGFWGPVQIDGNERTATANSV